ncbi:MAG: hypothetical protein KJ892_00085 [Gammaproteobacteria bacterium]|nr:hypothetical protein [Gammaproteobacteria bacterium]
MTTSNTLHSLLAPLGWQAFLPAFELLLQRFAGTEAWLDEGADSLPECLMQWLATMTDAEGRPKPLRLALLALRGWPLLSFRAAAQGRLWDYRHCSFSQFVQEAGEAGITVWFSPRRRAFPGLCQGLGFLRQHAQRSSPC